MAIGETKLTWRILLLTELLWDNRWFDGKTIIFKLDSLVGLIIGKYVPRQGEIDCIFLFLILMM